MIKFRFSDETKKMLATKRNPINKSRIDINSPQFYKNHPDLAPRNVYLEMGRVIDKKKVDRYLENIGEPFWVKAKNWCKYKLEDLFNKK